MEFFSKRPWQAMTAADLGFAAVVPTMLNAEEQSYYVALARDWARGQGAIVDLGSFAGGSAACLAEGVRQAGRVQVVHGYDKFEVLDFDAFRKRYRKYCASPPASESPHAAPDLPEVEDEDLLPVARAFLAPWGEGIRLCKGQIEDMGWTGGAIEILVMDASKTAATMDRMSATFFPHLRPGASVVVQQDFLWWQQPWIAAQMARLSDYFEPIVHIPRDSVSFLCTKAVPPALLAEMASDRLSDRDMIDSLRAMKQRVKPLKIDRQMRDLIASVKANPGKRKAYQFTSKP